MRFTRLAACGLVLAAGVPAYGQTPLQRGMALYGDGDYPEAIGIFLRVLQTDPTNPKALYYQRRAIEAALAQRRARMRLEGERMIAEGLLYRERGELVWGFCREGEIALKSDKLFKAEILFDRARELLPRHPCAGVGLSHVQRTMAERVVTKWLYDEAQGHMYKGFMSYNLGRLEEAAREWKKGLLLRNEEDQESFVVRSYLEKTLARLRSSPPSPPAAVSIPAAPPPPPPSRPAPPKGEAVDTKGSDRLYLQAVASYMRGELEPSRKALANALRSNPKNERARSLLQRIENELRGERR